MAPKEFGIVLEDANGGFYRPGETLCGKVLITLEKKNPYETLRIILLGQAKTSWWAKEDAGPFMVESVEEYLNFEAEMNIGQSVKIENAEYGFEYELAKGLPASFSSKYGRIEYFVKAILEGENERVQEATEREFIISGHVDLNDIPEASTPVELSRIQELLFDKGQLGMEVKLTKPGFVSGENIHVKSHFFNKSGEKDVHVHLHLMKETSYVNKNQKVTDSQIICTVEGPSLKPQGEEEWVGDLIQMPSLPVPFPFLQNCHLIELRYSLIFEMEIPMPNINLEGTIPLVIGTVSVGGVSTVNSPGPPSSTLGNPAVAPTQETAPKSQENKKRTRAGIRQKRALTTCLVFRPDRPRLQLPVPKPESWTKPHGAKEQAGAAAAVVVVELTPPTVDSGSQDLEEYISSMLELNKSIPPVVGQPPAPPASPASAPLDPAHTGKPKWPDAYIRRKEIGGANNTGAVAAESPDHSPELVRPPPKPARLLKKGVASIPEPDAPDAPASAQSPDASPTKKRTLPYPKSDPENFPLPDFAFNVISVNGQKQPPIGWNVTRNTLTLKRGAFLLQKIQGAGDGNCGRSNGDS